MNGFAKTSEPQALIGRTARHFGHKVPVTVSDGYASIETRFGRADLTAEAQGIAIALAAADDESLGSLREVVSSHMTRFARTPIEIRWFEGEEDGRA